MDLTASLYGPAVTPSLESAVIILSHTTFSLIKKLLNPFLPEPFRLVHWGSDSLLVKVPY